MLDMMDATVGIRIAGTLCACMLAASATPQTPSPQLPSVQEIVQRSAQATHLDWETAPDFDFCEMDRLHGGTKTYQVTMISGSPYYRLVASDDVQLSKEEDQIQNQKFAAAVQQRQQETPDQHQHRVAQYEKDRRRDQLILDEFAQAMSFTLTGTKLIDGYEAYLLSAVPKPGYVPRSIETRVLRAARGTMWIDEKSFRWVKVEAEVMHPVMIEGFLARIEPGTRFELEERPIGDPSGAWLITHLEIDSHASILLLFPSSSHTDETYFHYAPSGSLPPQECLHP